MFDPFDPFEDSKSSYQAIRKHSAAHDVYNRLHSIARDIEFVNRVSKEWYDGQLVVIPNQRCGVWYCDPSTSSPEYAYFKSTDGHTGQWDFSLRRANLQLVDFANRNGGFIIVDSTRRGKRMPDALSKTIPIWCAVINRAIAKRRSGDPTLGEQAGNWDSNLYCPPNVVSPTEKSQIEARLDGWAEQLLASSLTLPDPIAPLRPFFMHPGISRPPSIPTRSKDPEPSGISQPPFVPIVCLSASTFIEHGGPEPMRSRTGLGFEYIQGSGDDEDLWAEGLKAKVFHTYRDLLLSTPKQDLSKVIEKLKASSADDAVTLNSSRLATLTEIPPDSGLFLGVASTSDDVTAKGRLVLQLTRRTMDELANPEASEDCLFFRIPKSKKGDMYFVNTVLPACTEAAQQAVAAGGQVVLVDDDGKDVSVGVMVALSWLLVDDEGNRRREPAPTAAKSDTRTRLQWILDKRPGANPSRSTLQRVNEFLMSPRRP